MYYRKRRAFRLRLDPNVNNLNIIMCLFLFFFRLPEQNLYNVSDQSPVENQVVIETMVFSFLPVIAQCLHSQNSTDLAESILYADIGPSSFTNRPQISLSPDDSDHIEYAQLNQNLLTVKPDKTKPASSVGKNLLTPLKCPDKRGVLNYFRGHFYVARTTESVLILVDLSREVPL